MSLYRNTSDTSVAEGGQTMKKIKISVGKTPVENAVVNCRKVSISKRLFNKIFGEKATVTIVTPGNCVSSIEICDMQDGGQTDDSK